MNPFEIVQELMAKDRYQQFLCYEAGKKNKIFILVNEKRYHLIFKLTDGEYQDIEKTSDDIKHIVITASKTIGFEAKVSIQFKNDTNASFRVKNRFAAIE